MGEWLKRSNRDSQVLLNLGLMCVWGRVGGLLSCRVRLASLLSVVLASVVGVGVRFVVVIRLGVRVFMSLCAIDSR